MISISTTRTLKKYYTRQRYRFFLAIALVLSTAYPQYYQVVCINTGSPSPSLLGKTTTVNSSTIDATNSISSASSSTTINSGNWIHHSVVPNVNNRGSSSQSQSENSQSNLPPSHPTSVSINKIYKTTKNQPNGIQRSIISSLFSKFQRNCQKEDKDDDENLLWSTLPIPTTSGRLNRRDKTPRHSLPYKRNDGTTCTSDTEALLLSPRQNVAMLETQSDGNGLLRRSILPTSLQTTTTSEILVNDTFSHETDVLDDFSPDDESATLPTQNSAPYSSQQNDDDSTNIYYHRDNQSTKTITTTKPSESTSTKATSSTKANTSQGNPVIYRFFGRNRARSVRSDSVPFIVLGPTVDHWKVVGRILALRGFNVMACECVTNSTSSSGSSSPTSPADSHYPGKNGEALVTAVLDALKWPRAVLVGCDEESIMAIEAALRLAPERVAGVVLCGDLTKLQNHVNAQMFTSLYSDGKKSHESSDTLPEYISNQATTIDLFLRDYVDCPSAIIWDGDFASTFASSPSSKKAKRGQSSDFSLTMEEEELVTNGRHVIVGGGSSPHRRLPEQFAWILSRFVEEQVSLSSSHSHSSTAHNQKVHSDYSSYFLEHDEDTVSMVDSESSTEDDQSYEYYDQIDDEEEDEQYDYDISTDHARKRQNIWQEIIPSQVLNTINKIVTPGSLLVSGRAIATAVIYISVARVGIFQYQNLRNIPMSPFQFSKVQGKLMNVFARFTRALPFLSLLPSSENEGYDIHSDEGLEGKVEELEEEMSGDQAREESHNLNDPIIMSEEEEKKQQPSKPDVQMIPHRELWFLDHVVS